MYTYIGQKFWHAVGSQESSCFLFLLQCKSSDFLVTMKGNCLDSHQTANSSFSLVTQFDPVQVTEFGPARKDIHTLNGTCPKSGALSSTRTRTQSILLSTYIMWNAEKHPPFSTTCKGDLTPVDIPHKMILPETSLPFSSSCTATWSLDYQHPDCSLNTVSQYEWHSFHEGQTTA